MDFFALVLTALALSMDAFAVSVCKGLALKKAEWKHALIAGVWFGGFQALMPLLGYFIGSQFRDLVDAYTHWIAFGLLFLIGANMLREAIFEPSECSLETSLGPRVMLPMAIATSIDAMAVGVSFSCLEQVNIWAAIALIGAITCLISMAGVKIGSIFGAKFEKKAQILGGVILIGLGVKILLEHFGVL